jgi:hypothetical protein
MPDVNERHSPQEAARLLDTSLDNGLTDEEAARRLAKTGPNEYDKGLSIPFRVRLLWQMDNPIMVLLVVRLSPGAKRAALRRVHAERAAGVRGVTRHRRLRGGCRHHHYHHHHRYLRR